MSTRILSLPLPIFAAALAQPIDSPAMSAPAWITAAGVGAFVVLYFLNAAGRLPFANAERRTTGFDDTARHKLDEMHAIVMAEDEVLPRWRKVWSPTRETIATLDLVRELAEMRVTWEEERQEWHATNDACQAQRTKERDEWSAERARMERRITQLEETVRLQERAIDRGRA